MVEAEKYVSRHHDLLLPVARVRTDEAGGSGTVLYSKGGTTLLLTNEHVVDGAIKVKAEWSPLLRRDVKRDDLQPVEVHLFQYRYASRAVGATSIRATIATYSKKHDLALLRLEADLDAPAVAKLYPKGQENELMATMAVYAVGAGMGEPPVITEGMLSQFGILSDGQEFWLNTAPSIYGNSGGALFLKDTHELIGVPARIVVAMFGMQAITHLSYAIPVTRVYEFLDAEKYRFIYDPTHTEASETAERKRLQEESEKKMLVTPVETKREGRQE